MLDCILLKARETLRVMLMVQRRKRTQFTQKFKEHLEKVEGIIQEAIESLPDADIEGIHKMRKSACIARCLIFSIPH